MRSHIAHQTVRIGCPRTLRTATTASPTIVTGIRVMIARTHIVTMSTVNVIPVTGGWTRVVDIDIETELETEVLGRVACEGYRGFVLVGGF